MKRGEDTHNSSSPDSSSSPVELYHSVQQPIPSLRTRGGGRKAVREGGRKGRKKGGGGKEGGRREEVIKEGRE